MRGRINRCRWTSAQDKNVVVKRLEINAADSPGDLDQAAKALLFANRAAFVDESLPAPDERDSLYVMSPNSYQRRFICPRPVTGAGSRRGFRPIYSA
jgi:hypothetical protein